MNGKAKPNEYDVRRNIPLFMLSSVAAKTKIDPRIGPIQGVQPNAKANLTIMFTLYLPLNFLAITILAHDN